jgi:hypothetical protein
MQIFAADQRQLICQERDGLTYSGHAPGYLGTVTFKTTEQLFVTFKTTEQLFTDMSRTVGLQTPVMLIFPGPALA